MFSFFPFFPHCCEVMSPWHEDKNTLQCTCCSICRTTWGSCANLNGDGLAAEYLPLSNYKTASRQGELHLHNPFKVPNISFLFILNLFVQGSPFNAHYILSSEAAGGSWRRKQGVVSFSNPRMCQVDCITSYLDPSEAFLVRTFFGDSQHQPGSKICTCSCFIWEPLRQTCSTSLIPKHR